MMTIKGTTKLTGHQPRSKILTLVFLFAVGATHSAEAFSGVPSLRTSRIRCIRMVGGDISEEEILAMGGDPFFLPDDDESKAKETTEKNQQQPLLPQQQQLLQTLDTQYQELGNQYKAIGETISALKKEFGVVVDTADTADTKKNNNSQTASEILSNMGPATAEMPSFGMLSSLGMLEEEIEEERELTLEEQRLEIEEMGGDPFFLDDGSIDVENKDSSENQPSDALMAMASGGNGETPSILSFLGLGLGEDDEEEGEKELTLEERKLEIEELGGDPFFLGEDVGQGDAAVTSNVADRGEATRTDTGVAEERRPTDGMGPTPRFDKAELEDPPADFEWDGIVNEDAHLDFD